MPPEPKPGTPTCKIVVVGPPGSGKGSYVKAVATRLGPNAAREYRLAECSVVRAEFITHEPDGEILRVVLQTLTGPHDYAAPGELLLRGANGILFLCEADPARLGPIRESLRMLTEQAAQCEIHFNRVPVAVQYHRVERQPGFDASLMDQWLGIPAGGVPRFSTTSSRPDAAGLSFDTLMQLARQARVAPATPAV